MTQAGGDAPQQIGGAVDVAGRDGVVDRAVGLAARGVPRARPAVEVALDLGLAPAQLGAEHVREQAVVAVAVVGAVERDEHEVRAGEVAQRRARPRTAEHGVAQRAGELREHRGAGEEAQALARQAGEELVAQVVGDEPVVAGEPGDGAVAVGLLAERERGEVEAGGPPLGAVHEELDVGGPEAEAAEDLGGLAARHLQLARADLEDAAVRAQAADGQRQLAPRRDGEQRARREVPDDRVEDVARAVRRQDVRVVEDEHERRAAARDRRPEAGDGGVEAVCAGRAQGGERRRVRGARPRRARGRSRRRRRAASSSPGSSASHANGRGSRAAHSASAVVLP